MAAQSIRRLQRLYGLLTILCLALNVLVFFLFLAGMILRWDALAMLGKTCMIGGIRLAALATLIGLLWIYAGRKHSLTLDTAAHPSEEQPKDPLQTPNPEP